MKCKQATDSNTPPPEPGGIIRYASGSWEMIIGYRRQPIGPEDFVFVGHGMYRWPLFRPQHSDDSCEGVYEPPRLVRPF